MSYFYTVFRAHRFHRILPVILLCCFSQQLIAQKVGLVLSGGGVRGMAHLGVIKALEEANIPIDYITGTSAGALIGSMYAIGLRPDQIEKVMTSKDFVKWASGVFDEDHKYYYLRNPDDAAWATIKLQIDSIIKTQLPSNVVNTAEIDFSLMEQFASPSATANYDFDSLLVPFRCIASDITAKKPIIFSKGDLAQAVRASMAFPFYFSPVLIGENILYDGGIYNNFPTDIMLNTFQPDIMIGVSVASLPEMPSANNFLSQLKTMITQTTVYAVPRAQDILIEPKLSDINTFEFNAVSATIDSGYVSTKRLISTIKAAIPRAVNPEELEQKRKHLQQSGYHVTVDRIYVYGVNEDQATYIRTVLNPRNQCLNLAQLRKNWFKLIADENQVYLFPRLIFNASTNEYDLHVDVRKSKGLSIDFGGIISSKPINTGFISIRHSFWGQQSVRMQGNLYFGKLYNSAQLKMRLDIPGRLPFFAEPSFTINKMDYFKSSTSFFTDVKPSFLVQNDRSYAMSFGIPVRNEGKLIGGISAFKNLDKYYLTRSFSEKDTADETSMEGYSAYLFFERSTLNKKMYPNDGTFFEIRGRYSYSEEITKPGSTLILQDTIIEKHNWFQLNMRYENYFKTVKWYKSGFFMEMNFTNMPFLSNYIASKAQTQGFQPIPEMQTLFIESYRAHNYIGIGLKNVFRITENLNLRLEGYAYQPFQEILKRGNFKPYYGDAFNKRYFIATLNAVYYSPFGPVSVAGNYIEGREKELSFMFHLGYLLFNKRSTQ